MSPFLTRCLCTTCHLSLPRTTHVPVCFKCVMCASRAPNMSLVYEEVLCMKEAVRLYCVPNMFVVPEKESMKDIHILCPNAYLVPETNEKSHMYLLMYTECFMSLKEVHVKDVAMPRVCTEHVTQCV